MRYRSCLFDRLPSVIYYRLMYAMYNPERKYLGKERTKLNAEVSLKREIHADIVNISTVQAVDMTCIQEMRSKIRSLHIAKNHQLLSRQARFNNNGYRLTISHFESAFTLFSMEIERVVAACTFFHLLCILYSSRPITGRPEQVSAVRGTLLLAKQ